MKNLFLSAAVAVGLLASADEGNAAVYLAFSGSAITDIEIPPNPQTLEIRADGSDGAGTFGFRLSLFDDIETVSLTDAMGFNGGQFLFGGDRHNFFSYAGGVAADTLLATVVFTAGAVMPDDDRRDVGLVRFEDAARGITGAGILDPVTGDIVDRVAYDVQAVPLPAGLVLLASALGILGLRRRFA